MKITEVVSGTTREDFQETWLMESPENIGSFPAWPTIKNIILEIVDLAPTIDLGNGLRKIDLPSTVYYWIEQDGEFAIGVELGRKPQALVVQLTGKNPLFDHKPPYASALYLSILEDAGKNIRLRSDDKLSEDGYAIWEQLYNRKHKVCLYDKNNPSATFVRFPSLSDMNRYFQKDDKKYQDYQYVLCESKIGFTDAIAIFQTRKYREDLGIL
jgi:hypothetical protein